MVEIFPATFMEKQRQSAEVDNPSLQDSAVQNAVAERGAYPEDATQRATTLI
jgi:hypothetical protein